MMPHYREAGVQEADRDIPGRIGPTELVDQPHMAKRVPALRPPKPDRIATQHHSSAEAHRNQHGTIHLQRPKLLDSPTDRDFAADPFAIPNAPVKHHLEKTVYFLGRTTQVTRWDHRLLETWVIGHPLDRPDITTQRPIYNPGDGKPRGWAGRIIGRQLVQMLGRDTVGKPSHPQWLAQVFIQIVFNGVAGHFLEYPLQYKTTGDRMVSHLRPIHFHRPGGAEQTPDFITVPQHVYRRFSRDARNSPSV